MPNGSSKPGKRDSTVKKNAVKGSSAAPKGIDDDMGTNAYTVVPTTYAPAVVRRGKVPSNVGCITSGELDLQHG